MSYPSFTTGEVLTAADMNAVGLWLVKTQTVGTGVTEQEVTGAFSSTYDHYRITWTGGTTSAGGNIRLQLGSNTTNYHVNLLFNDYGSTTPQAASRNGTETSFDWCGSASSNGILCDITVRNPFLSKYTYISAAFDNDTSAGVTTGQVRNTTSFTSFKLIRSGTATFTGGTIRVYGMRN